MDNNKDKTTTATTTATDNNNNNNVEREREEGAEEQNPNNPNNNTNNGDDESEAVDGETGSQATSRARTPFTNLSQVDADLALARTLQEQERAYMMLRMNTDGSDYGSWEAASYLHDEEDDDDDDSQGDDNDQDQFDATDTDDDDDDDDAFDVHAHNEAGEGGGEEDDDDDDDDDHNPIVEYDTDAFSSDEAYARALQDAEEREMAARLLALAGINDRDIDDPEDHGANSQDTWEEIDPDELSYEELLALGEVIGTESRGLSTDTIASLPTVTYKSGSNQNGSNDSCVICRLDYEDDETLTVLSCKHSYHSDCINNWLKINKVCPVCSAEVSTSGNS